MGRAHRRKGPLTDAKRAREADYRERRRRADLERAQYRELAEQLRPVEMSEAELIADLVVRAAADGDESALRILTWREHLNAVGVVFPEDIDEPLWAAVKATHDGGTPRVPRGTFLPLTA
ncbi:hypothetical protein DEJ28_14170 [Curtobacterium sp. MCPF17_002]|uniref:hypothetical protein n=1 Tax=Curtobacterium sp. MCPF17_002 TaxID=2175645 RepID=UPI000DA6F3EB|nr:hypothetical protein [Curtobacterium sp. MCPF17_002]WIB76788.1 hypothetical protein DEJ28_14170 [Curtobacterium sp. MCPF17_002]